MLFFLSLIHYNHGLSTPFLPFCSHAAPIIRNVCVCVCVFPDVRGLVTHCPVLFCFLNLLLCLQVRASDFKPSINNSNWSLM